MTPVTSHQLPVTSYQSPVTRCLVWNKHNDSRRRKTRLAEGFVFSRRPPETKNATRSSAGIPKSKNETDTYLAFSMLFRGSVLNLVHTNPTREKYPTYSRSCRLYGSDAARWAVSYRSYRFCRPYRSCISGIYLYPERSIVDHELKTDDLCEEGSHFLRILLARNLLHVPSSTIKVFAKNSVGLWT